MFLVELGEYMNKAPWTRILEDTVCRERMGVGMGVRWEPEIPERECKTPEVQGVVAMLKGLDGGFSVSSSSYSSDWNLKFEMNRE